MKRREKWQANRILQLHYFERQSAQLKHTAAHQGQNGRGIQTQVNI